MCRYFITIEGKFRLHIYYDEFRNLYVDKNENGSETSLCLFASGRTMQ